MIANTIIIQGTSTNGLYRRVNGASPYLCLHGAVRDKGEESLIGYLALSAGPLNKDTTTMTTHVHGIGYFRRVKLGTNTVGVMAMVQLMTKGMRREKGPTARKLPFMVGDLMSPNAMLNLEPIDREILRRPSILGWFYAKNERASEN